MRKNAVALNCKSNRHAPAVFIFIFSALVLLGSKLEIALKLCEEEEGETEEGETEGGGVNVAEEPPLRLC